jgi:hypothetical protein
MAFKTFTAGTLATASDINTYLMKQSVSTFANVAARNAAITSPTEGQLAYTSDTDIFSYWDGSAWIPLIYGKDWTTGFTPSYTGIFAGNGTFDFAYARFGKTIFYRGAFTLGSTSTLSTNISFSLPVSGANSNRQFGQAVFQHSTFYNGVAYMTGPTYLNFYAFNTAGTYSSLSAISGTGNIPQAWVNGNTLSFVITYQAA